MSDSDDLNEPEPTKTGYKSAPLSARFQPGHSGNPKGRPKARRSLEEEILEELDETVDIGEFTITKQRAIAMSLVNNAIKGNVRAVMMIFALCKQNSEEGPDSSDEDHEQRIFEEMVEREVLNRLDKLKQENAQ